MMFFEIWLLKILYAMVQSIIQAILIQFFYYWNFQKHFSYFEELDWYFHEYLLIILKMFHFFYKFVVSVELWYKKVELKLIFWLLMSFDFENYEKGACLQKGYLLNHFLHRLSYLPSKPSLLLFLFTLFLQTTFLPSNIHSLLVLHHSIQQVWPDLPQQTCLKVLLLHLRFHLSSQVYLQSLSTITSRFNFLL